MAKYKGLDGKEYNLKLRLHSNKFKSQYHVKAYDLFKKVYPLYSLYEETKLCGTKNDLYLDLFCPSLNLGIEVNGEQHEKFNPYFHQNIVGFARSKARDSEKVQWCQMNGIILIQLNYDEEKEWERKISQLTNE